MAVLADGSIMTDDSEELYDRLEGKLGRGGTYTYEARHWKDFLEFFGYDRTDQHRVTCAIKSLEAAGLVQRATIKCRSGHHASSHRQHDQSPRKVTITVLR